MPIQTGCSPYGARCSAQPTVTRVRLAAISRARVTIRSAGTPEISSAQRRRLGDAVGLAQQIALEGLVPCGVAVEERAVVQPLGHQRMRDPEHHGHIGTGTGGHPFGRHLGQIVLERAERNEAHAVVGGGMQIRAHLMGGHAARADEGVLDRQTAERTTSSALSMICRQLVAN